MLSSNEPAVDLAIQPSQDQDPDPDPVPGADSLPVQPRLLHFLDFSVRAQGDS